MAALIGRPIADARERRAASPADRRGAAAGAIWASTPISRSARPCNRGDFAGAEALLRQEHPTHGLLMPDEFLDIAEDTGLIVQIGASVIDQSCRELFH